MELVLSGFRSKARDVNGVTGGRHCVYGCFGISDLRYGRMEV